MIYLPKYSVQEKKQGKPFPRPYGGRQTNPKLGYESPASHLDDLAAQKKCIILCSFCQPKWGNPRKKGYRARFVPDPSGATSGFAVHGQCDACKQNTADMGGGKLYINEEEYRVLSMDPQEAKKRARDAWRNDKQLSELNKVMADAKSNPYKYPAKKKAFAVTDKRRFK